MRSILERILRVPSRANALAFEIVLGNATGKMLRRLVVLVAFACLAWSQGTQKAFLHEVEDLQLRTLNGQPIDPLLRLQTEIGLSVPSAEAIFETVRAYNAEADKVNQSLKRSILNRRIQVAGENGVTYSPELDLVNWANLDLNLFLLEQMDALSSRMPEEEYLKLLRFLEDRAPSGAFFPLQTGEAAPIGPRLTGQWRQSPLGFWRDTVKAPLSGPDAESLFVQNYKDALLPPADIVYYMEGTVVSVTPEDSQGRRILLSMQGEGAPDAALLIDGVDWKLRKEPQKGEIVRFSGTPREFTPEPFLILFAPERIAGLSVESTHPNPPFTIPGLAR